MIWPDLNYYSYNELNESRVSFGTDLNWGRPCDYCFVFIILAF